MGKSTISMAIFNSFLYVYQRVFANKPNYLCWESFLHTTFTYLLAFIHHIFPSQFLLAGSWYFRCLCKTSFFVRHHHFACLNHVKNHHSGWWNTIFWLVLIHIFAEASGIPDHWPAQVDQLDSSVDFARAYGTLGWALSKANAELS